MTSQVIGTAWADSTPKGGRQASPTLGRRPQVGFDSMKGARRPKFVATRTRKVLAGNVLSRMDERYAREPDRVRALSEASGVSRSTVQRVLDADVIGASIDTLTQMANALHCEPYELLMPDRFLSRRSGSQAEGNDKGRSPPAPVGRLD